MNPADALRELLPSGTVVLACRDAITVIAPSGDALTIDPRERDVYGSWTFVVRVLDPCPGFTRQCLGQLELERLHRRRRRGLRP